MTSSTVRPPNAPEGRPTPSPMVLVWAGLVGATLLSWLLGAQTGHGTSSRAGSVLVVLVAFVKVHLVGTYFMEIRRAPEALRRAFLCWEAVTCALILAVYLSN